MSVSGPSSKKYDVLQWSVDGSIKEIGQAKTAAEAKKLIKSEAKKQSVPVDNFAYSKHDSKADLNQEWVDGRHIPVSSSVANSSGNSVGWGSNGSVGGGS